MRAPLYVIRALVALFAFFAGQTLADPVVTPSWLYPLLPPVPANPPPFDQLKPLHVPQSGVTYTEAQLNDLFSAPDWFPKSHTPMPGVVARGRAPDVLACGFCHTPSGQGRPENASLAGLPVDYILRQVADMKSGARRSGAIGLYRPSDRMMDEARHVNDTEISAAASYFSRQQFTSHVHVIETARVPRSRVVGWVYAAIAGTGVAGTGVAGVNDEPLGVRLMEFAPDAERHELRDDNLVYTAYVPPGSLARGLLLARGGGATVAPPCIACHGDHLQGTSVIPRLAGRSPTYLLRQLVAFKSGARAGANAALMRMVVANLQIGDMIDVAAYAASLESP
jgi:cytochrome c553